MKIVGVSNNLDPVARRDDDVPYAMGQSADRVKQQATHTTASYVDEGFARAIETTILGQEARP